MSTLLLNYDRIEDVAPAAGALYAQDSTVSSIGCAVAAGGAAFAAIRIIGATNDTTYRLTFTGNGTTRTVSYLSDATATDVEIADGLVAAINADALIGTYLTASREVGAPTVEIRAKQLNVNFTVVDPDGNADIDTPLYVAAGAGTSIGFGNMCLIGKSAASATAGGAARTASALTAVPAGISPFLMQFYLRSGDTATYFSYMTAVIGAGDTLGLVIEGDFRGLGVLDKLEATVPFNTDVATTLDDLKTAYDAALVGYSASLFVDQGVFPDLPFFGGASGTVTQVRSVMLGFAFKAKLVLTQTSGVVTDAPVPLETTGAPAFAQESGSARGGVAMKAHNHEQDADGNFSYSTGDALTALTQGTIYVEVDANNPAIPTTGPFGCYVGVDSTAAAGHAGKIFTSVPNFSTTSINVMPLSALGLGFEYVDMNGVSTTGARLTPLTGFNGKTILCLRVFPQVLVR